MAVALLACTAVATPSHAPLLPQFAAHPLVARELSAFQRGCACTQRIEAGRAQLHASLERVLVIDMRFVWNGIGNSLVRWLAVLRMGTAAGFATFLWFSDRDPPSEDPPGRRLGFGRGVRRRGRRQGGPSDAWSRPHGVRRHTGFDLGDYFVAVGADYRWSRAAHRRVAAAMARRNVSNPMLVQYSCLKHTWACMRPQLEWGPLAPVPLDAADAAGAAGAAGGVAPLDQLSGGFAQPPASANCTHENERDGWMVAWFAQRKEPWLLLRLAEQTAIEPSADAAGAVLSGAWAGARDRAGLEPPLPSSPTHACGECRAGGLGKKGRGGRARAKRGLLGSMLGGGGAAGAAAGRRTAEADACAHDHHPGHVGFHAAHPPKDPALLPFWQEATRADWAAAPLRALRRHRGPHKFSSPCFDWAVLRPRPWLQRAMLPYLDRLTRAGGPPMLSLHMRTGYADWQCVEITVYIISRRG